MAGRAIPHQGFPEWAFDLVFAKQQANLLDYGTWIGLSPHGAQGWSTNYNGWAFGP